MDMRITLVFTVLLVLTIITLSVTLVLITPRGPEVENVKSTNTISKISRPINFTLYDPRKVMISRPKVIYKLDNGSVIIVDRKNPFEFHIIVDPSLYLTTPTTLKVYRIEIYTTAEEVLSLARRLGIEVGKLYFNNITKKYLFYNDRFSFEYSIDNGFVRVQYHIKEQSSESMFSSENVLIKNALSFLRDRGLIYVNDYDIKVKDYLVSNSTVVLKSVTLYPKIDGVIAKNFGFMVILDSAGNIVGFEGIVIENLDVVGEYRAKSIDDVVKELKKKISHGDPMTDWFIDWLAFTDLKIKNMTLQYFLTSKGYIVPIYVIDCEYSLDYNGIHDKGTTQAMIIAILSNTTSTIPS